MNNPKPRQPEAEPRPISSVKEPDARRRLKRRELTLKDGRYLLVYGYESTGAPDA
jgi:hypothetical protein